MSERERDAALERLREEHERIAEEQRERGVKPVSDLPGSGFGSFAEDAPEVHESFRNRNRGLPEGDEAIRRQDED